MMDKAAQQVSQILQDFSIRPESKNQNLMRDFAQQVPIQQQLNQINNLQKGIMQEWQRFERIREIQEQNFKLPNGIVGKAYYYQLDAEQLQLDDLATLQFEAPLPAGLQYDPATKILSGFPDSSGDLKLNLSFTFKDQPETEQYHSKLVTLIINPDPKSLWKDIPSAADGLFPKADQVQLSDEFLNKRLVLSSKRGRSHANIGSYREDDFSYQNYSNGWSIIALSDGAGSAQYSREASRLACSAVVSYFRERVQHPAYQELDQLITDYQIGDNAKQTEITQRVQQEICHAALHTHKEVLSFAKSINAGAKDVHATLIFCLVKQYASGYAILSFSVGDCPMALLNKDLSQVQLLHTLDVGDYAGGTRFITMPEIFDDPGFAQRIGFNLVPDFSYLMLMTDGIYDPKFVTESNLHKIEKWKALMSDLEGDNADAAAVDFSADNLEVARQLSSWMDFWESGNHDDRTLAIIY
jgi:hypothetical protein